MFNTVLASSNFFEVFIPYGIYRGPVSKIKLIYIIIIIPFSSLRSEKRLKDDLKRTLHNKIKTREELCVISMSLGTCESQGEREEYPSPFPLAFILKLLIY